MKYLSILTDSFREAIDSKVFYVTVGLSGLLILLVGSVTFRPVPAREALQSVVQDRQFLTVFRDRGRSLDAAFYFVTYYIDNIQKLNDADDREPQAGDYRFNLNVVESQDKAFRNAVKSWSMPADLRDEKNQEAETDVPDSLIEEFIKEQFDVVGNVKVTRVQKVNVTEQTLQANPRTPGTLVLEVETKGTKAVRGWQHDPCLFFGALPLRFMRASLGYRVFWIEDILVNGIGGWIGILLGIVISAFFIPNMLRKGTVDLLLVKPIHRSTLLVYKYLGGLSFIFLNSVIAVGGVWLALGLRSGIWAPGFLLTIVVLTFFFAILYSVSALFGVLTRSAIVSILITCFVWAILWVVGQIYIGLEFVRSEPRFRSEIPDWVYTTAEIVHFVLPRTKDLDLLTSRLLSAQVLTEGEIRQSRLDRTTSITWGESLSVSGAFIGVLLALACWRFATKDY